MKSFYGQSFGRSAALTFGGLAVIVLGLLAVLWFSSAVLSRTYKNYSNDTYGVSFAYPKQYVIQEGIVGEGADEHYTISIIDGTALQMVPERGEMPPAIVVQFYPNPQRQALGEWITRNPSASNYERVLGSLGSSTVGTRSAVRYAWDGLYRAETFVTEHAGAIAMFSVMYDAPTDQIRQDFDALLGSVQFKQ